MEKEESAEKLIYIIGPRSLQNDLLASFLLRETGIACEGLGSLQDIPITEGTDNSQSRLILWDFLGKSLKTCRSELESYSEKRFSQDLFALFNLTQGQGIEETAIAWGVKGVFYENDPMNFFPKGVCSIFNGELWFSREIMTRHILKQKRREHNFIKDAASLSRREVDVISMVAIGCTNEEIADRLCISRNTVKTHIYNIFKKINVPNRLQAALWAAENL